MFHATAFYLRLLVAMGSESIQVPPPANKPLLHHTPTPILLTFSASTKETDNRPKTERQERQRDRETETESTFHFYTHNNNKREKTNMEENFPRGRRPRRPHDDDDDVEQLGQRTVEGNPSVDTTRNGKQQQERNHNKRLQSATSGTSKDDDHHLEERRRLLLQQKKKRVASDFLFGGGGTTGKDDDNNNNTNNKSHHKRHKVQTDPHDPQQAHLSLSSSLTNSILPLGGGGVIVQSSSSSSSPTTKSRGSFSSSSSLLSSSHRWIESLGFSKLHKGMRVLAVVREVYDDLAIFSLPNHWTGFMMLVLPKKHHIHGNNDNTTTNTIRVHVGQVLAVSIVKAVQEEATKHHGGQTRRRIQVSCLPRDVNAGLFLDASDETGQQLNQLRGTNDTIPSSSSVVAAALSKGTVVRGRVQTVEDHGLLIDLGLGQGGFLAFADIEGTYRLLDDDDEDDDEDDVVKDDDGKDEPNPTLKKKKKNSPATTTTTKDDHGDMALEHVMLGEGSILDLVVKKSTSSSRHNTSTSSSIVALSLPSRRTLAKIITTIPSRQSSLHRLQPGQLIRTTVEAWAQNGLCVQFGDSNSNAAKFRGAIERQHLGSFVLPQNNTRKKKKSDGGGDDDDGHVGQTWQSLLPLGEVVLARIIVVDPQTKWIRFSMQSHLINYSQYYGIPTTTTTQQQPPLQLPTVGTLFRKATVLRRDPGVGALLALPTTLDDDEDDDDINGEKEQQQLVVHNRPKEVDPLHPPASTDERYIKGQDIQVAYVHISKAMDDYNNNSKGKDSQQATMHAAFLKQFAVSTRHDVRILGTSNWLEGFASGGTASSIVNAHVVSHADLHPGQVYKQVPIVRGAEPTLNGTASAAVIVDFGLGVKGLIPPHHLFDQVAASSSSSSSTRNHYRSQLLKVKYALNAKVNVRIWTVDVANRICIVTAKKSLVTAPSHKIWSSYEALRVGQVGLGVVSKVDVNKGLYVTFCNDVHGFIPKRHLRQQQLHQFSQNARNDDDDDEEQSSYDVGDVISCRVLHVQNQQDQQAQQEQQPRQRRRQTDEDGGNPQRRWQWILTLGLATNHDDDDKNQDTDAPSTATLTLEQQQRRMHIAVGCLLPKQSLRVLELKDCHEKTNKNGGTVVVPGFAIVEVATKHLSIDIDVGKEKKDSGGGNRDLLKEELLPKSIECKLGFDQLVDEYAPEIIESASAWNAFARERLEIGRLVRGKSMILADPHKTIGEHANGIGKLTTVTLRPKLLLQATHDDIQPKPSKDDDDNNENNHFLYVGAVFPGVVNSVDPRYGAFVRLFAKNKDEMSGLVPKADGGLNLTLYSTVQTRVVVIRPVVVVDNGQQQQQQKLLLSTKLVGNRSTAAAGSNHGDKVFSLASVGDIIETVVVENVLFDRALVKLQQPKFFGSPNTGSNTKNKVLRAWIHCTSMWTTPTSNDSGTSLHVQTYTMRNDNDEEKGQNNLGWHSDHPFRKWKPGLEIKNLVVIATQGDDKEGKSPSKKKGAASLFLGAASSCAATDSDIASMEKGTQVHGFITSVSEGGIWVSLSPSWDGFVPAIETSMKLDDIQDLDSRFSRGQRVSAYILRRQTMRIRKENKEVLLLSIVGWGGDTSNGAMVSLTKPGTVVVGRVNRKISLGTASPSLVFDLPGGRLGRCCITELADPDDWVNFPLGNPLKRRRSEQFVSERKRSKIISNTISNGKNDDDDMMEEDVGGDYEFNDKHEDVKSR